MLNDPFMKVGHLGYLISLGFDVGTVQTAQEPMTKYRKYYGQYSILEDLTSTNSKSSQNNKSEKAGKVIYPLNEKFFKRLESSSYLIILISYMIRMVMID